jgi:hypothetical protein
MGISNLTAWAKYLSNPLVLVGFVMMLFASIMITMMKKNVFRLSQTASEKILKLMLYCIFVLVLVTETFSFLYALKSGSIISEETIISQETKGKQSPNIVTGTSHGKVSIEQKSSGKQSPNIISNEKEKSVEINYDYKHAKKNREGEEDLK